VGEDRAGGRECLARPPKLTEGRARRAKAAEHAALGCMKRRAGRLSRAEATGCVQGRRVEGGRGSRRRAEREAADGPDAS
jgi:hypothetical protein